MKGIAGRMTLIPRQVPFNDFYGQKPDRYLTRPKQVSRAPDVKKNLGYTLPSFARQAYPYDSYRAQTYPARNGYNRNGASPTGFTSPLVGQAANASYNRALAALTTLKIRLAGGK